ncbi:MAG: hypothetical protein ACRENA_01700 [Vulcanimicrobiaceae bacterium]
MPRGLGIAGILSVAGCGTLAGHALTYLLEGRAMEDGRHAYFSPLLEMAVAIAIFCGIALAFRLLSVARCGRTFEAPPLPWLCTTLAVLQVSGFVVLEFSEGNRPDLIGCAIEALTALLIAIVVALALAFVERCVVPILARYLRRRDDARPPVASPSSPVVRPSLLLTASAGVRRFKRPPPAFG